MTRKPARPAKAGLPLRRLIVELDEDAYEQLLANAQRRNRVLADFTAGLLETIVADDLIPEILGEGNEAA